MDLWNAAFIARLVVTMHKYAVMQLECCKQGCMDTIDAR
jgi:hypothetical protein